MFRISEVGCEVQKFVMKFTNQFVKLAFDWLHSITICIKACIGDLFICSTVVKLIELGKERWKCYLFLASWQTTQLIGHWSQKPKRNIFQPCCIQGVPKNATSSNSNYCINSNNLL